MRTAHSLFLYLLFSGEEKGLPERDTGRKTTRHKLPTFCFLPLLFTIRYIIHGPEELITRPVQLLLQYFKFNYHFLCLKFELYYMRLKRAIFAH